MTAPNSVYEKLTALGIALPPLTPPVAAFVPFVRTGNLVFVSGHIAKKNGTPWMGQAAIGNLDLVSRIVKLLILVNSAPSFTEHHLVANGASELLLEVFGDRGAHARSAFGVAQIPFGACVEIEMIVEARPTDTARAVGTE